MVGCLVRQLTSYILTLSFILNYFALKAQSDVNNGLSTYPIVAIPINDVKIEDDFWLPIIKKVQNKTIDFAIKKCIEEGRLDNFLIAGGQLKGETKGAMPFDDTDIYKIIEGASNTLISAPDATLEQQLDSLIAIIAIGQEADGYLTTWRTINPRKPPANWVAVVNGDRWESLEASHELYNAGHLFEAAYTHYIATGKRNFLDIAIKNADLLVKTFGDGPDQIKGVPGHQIVETGLIKLYDATQNIDYLNLSKYFLDHRGDPMHHKLNGPYSQDHKPVIEQDEAVGHAVRAVYMYAAMTDIAVLHDDKKYDVATQNIWQNMVHKKMYITGGIGAKHDGEAFGENYELPNLTSYNETCASIGNVYWNQRLHAQHGQAHYSNLIERTLYNGLISGLSLDGINFFYPNALESDGKYKFNRGSCTRQEWFDCSCCPTNLIRFIPALPGLIYSTAANEMYVNMYVTSTASMTHQNKLVKIKQESGFPWSGGVKIRITAADGVKSKLKLRIPDWVKNKPMPGNLYKYIDKQTPDITCKLNGKSIIFDVHGDYIDIDHLWHNDVVELFFDMPVRLVESNDIVTNNIGKVALERGPLVYAVEEADNPNFDEIYLTRDDNFSSRFEHDLLGGVVTIQNKRWKAIPYYAWSNRGVGKMKVWIDYKK